MENQPTTKTPEVKPVVSPEIVKQTMDNMPPSETLDTKNVPVLPKEDVSENLAKQKSLKDRIMKFFEAKPVSEMNDPVKIQKMLAEDIQNILHASGQTSGGGAEFGKGTISAVSFYKKYELGETGKAIAEELDSITAEFGKTSDKLLDLRATKKPIPEDLRAKGVELYNNKNSKNAQFFSLMKDAVEKRIAQLQ